MIKYVVTAKGAMVSCPLVNSRDVVDYILPEGTVLDYDEATGELYYKGRLTNDSVGFHVKHGFIKRLET